jgi:hypothetical protein
MKDKQPVHFSLSHQNQNLARLHIQPKKPIPETMHAHDVPMKSWRKVHGNNEINFSLRFSTKSVSKYGFEATTDISHGFLVGTRYAFTLHFTSPNQNISAAKLEVIDDQHYSILFEADEVVRSGHVFHGMTSGIIQTKVIRHIHPTKNSKRHPTHQHFRLTFLGTSQEDPREVAVLQTYESTNFSVLPKVNRMIKSRLHTWGNGSINGTSDVTHVNLKMEEKQELTRSPQTPDSDGCTKDGFDKSHPIIQCECDVDRFFN